MGILYREREMETIALKIFIITYKRLVSVTFFYSEIWKHQKNSFF